MKKYFVYIVKCSDGSYYTGISSNLEKRLLDHNQGKHPDGYTYKRRPVTLMYYAEFTEPEAAIEVEKQIKKWSRAKKEALIEGDYDALINLAKKNFKL
ncbi:MAG: GIY-YIG nuclease family protein [Flavobacteriaceae bacterium]